MSEIPKRVDESAPRVVLDLHAGPYQWSTWEHDNYAHEHAVARVAVEALRKITAGWLPGNCGQIGDEALAKIEASGWKP